MKFLFALTLLLLLIGILVVDAQAATKPPKLKKKEAPASGFVEHGLLCLQRKQRKKAVVLFRKATERAPNLPDAYLHLGRAQAQKKASYSAARRALKRFLKLQPKGSGAEEARGILNRLK